MAMYCGKGPVVYMNEKPPWWPPPDPDDPIIW
jgi:hypothetical protein